MIIDDNNANPVTTIQSLWRIAELVNPPIKLLANARINNIHTITSGTLALNRTSLVVAMSNIAFNAGIMLLEGMSILGSLDCCIALDHKASPTFAASSFALYHRVVSVTWS